MARKISILMLIFFAVNFTSLWAYDETVHREMGRNAADRNNSILDEVLQSQLGIIEGITTEIKKGNETKTIREWIAFGGEAEDYGNKGEKGEKKFIASTRGYNHYHDPLEDWDNAGFKHDINLLYTQFYRGLPVSALLWALKPGEQDFEENTTGDWSWSNARYYFYQALTNPTEDERIEKFADCFRALGQVMHLLQDMSVPLHTRNDVHIFPLDWLPEIGVNARWTYEAYVKNTSVNDLDFTPDMPGDRPDSRLLEIPSIIPDPNYANLLPVTGLFDRNAYSATGPIPQNDILGLAEYSNAHFLTLDTMWTYPHPSLDDTNYLNIDWVHPEEVLAEDGKVDRRLYVRFKEGVGEDIKHLAAVDYYAREYMADLPFVERDAFTLDRLCWKDYANKLIPRAVGYSAALLDYFFRGEIDLVPDLEEGGYFIINKTEKEMDGTFELYYDNIDEQRVRLWTSDFNVGPSSSANNKSPSIALEPPVDAKDPGKYLLVFKGRLGNEEGAVVGKVIHPPIFFKMFIDGEDILYGRVKFTLKWWDVHGAEHKENHTVPGYGEKYTSPEGTVFSYTTGLIGPFFPSLIDLKKPIFFSLHRDRDSITPENTKLCESWSVSRWTTKAYTDGNGSWARVLISRGPYSASYSIYYLLNWVFSAVYPDPDGELLLGSFSDEPFFPYDHKGENFECSDCCVDGVYYGLSDERHIGVNPITLYGHGYAFCYYNERAIVESMTGISFGTQRYSMVTRLDMDKDIGPLLNGIYKRPNVVTCHSASENPNNPRADTWVLDVDLPYGIKRRAVTKTFIQGPDGCDDADPSRKYGLGTNNSLYTGHYPQNPYEWAAGNYFVDVKWYRESWLPIIKYDLIRDEVHWEPEFIEKLAENPLPHMDAIWFGIRDYEHGNVADPGYSALMCWNPYIDKGETGWENAKMWQVWHMGPVTLIPGSPFDDIGPNILPKDGGPWPLSDDQEANYTLQKELGWWNIGHMGGNYYPGVCAGTSTIDEVIEVSNSVTSLLY